MQPKVLLVRGIPASGKTTYANRLADQLKCTAHEYGETNDEYACIQKAMETMEFSGEEETVLVANFIKSQDFMPILEAFSQRFGSIDFQFYIATEGDGKSENVAMSTIDRMKMNFQTNESVIADLKKRYPQHRYFDCWQPKQPRYKTRK